MEEQCPQCNTNNTEFLYSQQLRASDEPPTMFYKCNTCKKNFRCN